MDYVTECIKGLVVMGSMFIFAETIILVFSH